MGNYELLEETSGKNERAESTEEPELIESLGKGVFLERIEGMMEKVKDLFEGSEKNEGIIGNPEKDMETWHVQEGAMSCAVCCQEFIAEQVTGRNFSEQEFCDFAERQGWFDPEGGTPFLDVGNILEYMGFEVTRQEGVSIQEMAQMLENGKKIIVGVNNMILANPEMANIPGLNANHAVQVIGIDMTDPNDIQVILNDPGVPNGRGIHHSLNTFMSAWNTSNHFVVSAVKE